MKEKNQLPEQEHVSSSAVTQVSSEQGLEFLLRAHPGPRPPASPAHDTGLVPASPGSAQCSERMLSVWPEGLSCGYLAARAPDSCS